MQKLYVLLNVLLYVFSVSTLSLFCTVFSSVSHSEIRTSLLTQGLSFLSPDYENTEATYFMFVGATLISNTSSEAKSDDAFKINLTAQYAIGNSVLSYLNIREIYSTIKIDDKSVLHIGRKLQNWSALDTIWNLGVYQPQFKWNPLTPENQGLTGLFWNKNNSGFNLILFASPLYLPNQSASYELKDGQFQSSNPWFASPPQNIKFQNQLLPIDYVIDKPEVNSVIFQTQFGAQTKFGEAKGYFANIGGFYKPANQLAIGYKGVLVANGRVRVDITPKLYFENAYSADLGYRQDWGLAQLSLLYSQPQNPTFDASFTAPEFEPSLSWGPQLLYKFKAFDFFIAYLDTSGGEVKDVGEFASDDQPSLSQRFLYSQALQLQLKYSDVFWNQVRLDSTLQFMTSAKEGFRQIRFKNSFNLKGPLAFWLDFLLIDTDSSIPSNLESYKSSDQVWLGVSYDI